MTADSGSLEICIFSDLRTEDWEALIDEFQSAGFVLSVESGGLVEFLPLGPLSEDSEWITERLSNFEVRDLIRKKIDLRERIGFVFVNQCDQLNRLHLWSEPTEDQKSKFVFLLPDSVDRINGTSVVDFRPYAMIIAPIFLTLFKEFELRFTQYIDR